MLENQRHHERYGQDHYVIEKAGTSPFTTSEMPDKTPAVTGPSFTRGLLMTPPRCQHPSIQESPRRTRRSGDPAPKPTTTVPTTGHGVKEQYARLASSRDDGGTHNDRSQGAKRREVHAREEHGHRNDRPGECGKRPLPPLRQDRIHPRKTMARISTAKNAAMPIISIDSSCPSRTLLTHCAATRLRRAGSGTRGRPRE